MLKASYKKVSYQTAFETFSVDIPFIENFIAEELTGEHHVIMTPFYNRAHQDISNLLCCVMHRELFAKDGKHFG